MCGVQPWNGLGETREECRGGGGGRDQGPDKKTRSIRAQGQGPHPKMQVHQASQVLGPLASDHASFEFRKTKSQETSKM